MNLLTLYRVARVAIRQVLQLEPIVLVRKRLDLEFHGDRYCGWAMPVSGLDGSSIVFDVGLGENVSFSTSIIDKYGCPVHGFDPTPRAINYVKSLGSSRITVHEYGLGAQSGISKFFLPNDEANVSGSIVCEPHVGHNHISVQIKTLEEFLQVANVDHVDLLKMDIEGAEFDVIASDDFGFLSKKIGILCIEFHHRWPTFGAIATKRAVSRLDKLGFKCVWRSLESNEEFTFVNVKFSKAL
jgi:FkbM family methyltransferase